MMTKMVINKRCSSSSSFMQMLQQTRIQKNSKPLSQFSQNPEKKLIFHFFLKHFTMETSPNTIDTSNKSFVVVILKDEESKGLSFIPKPSIEKEKISIWKTQMLFLFVVSDKLLAFLGPYPTPKSHPKKSSKILLLSCFYYPSHIWTTGSRLEVHGSLCKVFSINSYS